MTDLGLWTGRVPIQAIVLDLTLGDLRMVEARDYLAGEPRTQLGGATNVLGTRVSWLPHAFVS
jgi:hypothetical protein